MKKPIEKIAGLFLILVMAGCNLPGKTKAVPVETAQALVPVGQAVSSLEPAPINPAAIPNRVPSGYSDLLKAKVAAGEWTREYGLITLLKLAAGEQTAAKAGLGAGVQSTELTGILRSADQYLKIGTDQAAREEIKRLLNIIAPSQAALDRYSIPEAQASHRSHGLAAPVQQDQLECEHLWAEGFPDTRSAAFPCFLFDKLKIGEFSYQVYYPLAWRSDASRFSYYRSVLRAVQDSINLYGTFGDVKSIYFVFNPLAAAEIKPGDNTDAEMGGIHFSETEGCPVIIYPRVFAYTIPEFKQVLAHEIFHCFQHWNLNHQFNDTGDDSNWWSEGTSEYFSNLVYPAVNLEHQWSNDFAALSTMKPLTDMSYENFAFFQFLGNTITPAGVLGMLGRMPRSPGLSAQTAALAAEPDIADHFEAFTRSILDHTLMDSDGMVIDLPDYYTDEFTFSDITSKDFSGKPFVAARYQVSFASEKSFILETRETGDGRSSSRASGSIGGWEPMPSSISGGCDELPYFLYAITAVAGAERIVTITTTSFKDTPCDRCLIGRWEAENASVVRYMQSVVDKGGADVPTVESAEGVMFMEFAADGTGAGGYENLNVLESGVGGNPNSSVMVTFEGFSSGPFTAYGSQLTGLNKTMDIVVKVDVFVGGKRFSSSTVPSVQADLPVGSANPARYNCADDTLTLWPPVSGSSLAPLVYQRKTP